MERIVKRVWTEEKSNTTIDWMVLTAGLVLLGAALMVTITGASTEVADTGTFQIEVTTTDL